MTTKTVGVPRDDLLELLEDGVDDYWITSESGVRIVEILRASLAQPVEIEPVAFVGGDEVRRFITWAPDKPAFVHPVGTPLYLHPPAPADHIPDARKMVIPEGYALVPIEPTEAMRDAGNIYSLNRATLMRIWADMLDAAQQPTEGSTMNNANQQHYFKSEWNDKYHCAQCGEYITAERHIRAPRVGLLATLKPHGRKAK